MVGLDGYLVAVICGLIFDVSLFGGWVLGLVCCLNLGFKVVCGYLVVLLFDLLCLG